MNHGNEFCSIFQEELFRASLSAKNEEISKMTDVLRSVRAELAREVQLVHKLNAQVVAHIFFLIVELLH